MIVPNWQKIKEKFLPGVTFYGLYRQFYVSMSQSGLFFLHL